MCLAVPGKIVDVRDERGTRMATIDFDGIRKEICLAYLPEIKKRLAQPKPPKVVFLPDPSLTEKNFRDPVQTLGEAASDRGISVDQVRREARDEVTEWLALRGEVERFAGLLNFA